MEKSSVIPFYELCRICLEQSGAKNIFDIIGLTDDIFTCTGVQIFYPNKLPNMICLKCYEVIQLAKNLRLLAQRSDAHLRLIFNENDGGALQVSQSADILSMSSEECFQQPDEEETRMAVDNLLESSTTVYNASDSITKEKETSENHIGSQGNKLCTIIVVDNEDVWNKIKEEDDQEDYCSVQSPVINKRNSSSQEDDCIKPSKKIKVEDEVEDCYVCGTCSKMYTTWKKLSTHQRTHNKKIVCTLEGCGKKFSTKADLQKHTRTHTGEKPYKCDICKKSFAQPVTLRAHKKAVHQTKRSEIVQSSDRISNCSDSENTVGE